MRTVDEHKTIPYNLRPRKNNREEVKTPVKDSKPIPGIKKHPISKDKGRALIEDQRKVSMKKGHTEYCKILIELRALYAKIESSSPIWPSSRSQT